VGGIRRANHHQSPPTILSATIPTVRRREILGLRTVAVFEAAKGLTVLAAGSGLLLLVHRDLQEIAARLIEHLHLNPASHYPEIFLRIATGATPRRLRLLALGAALYSTIRLLEAVGLWRGKSWAEWLGVLTGLIYVPFEVLSLIRRPGPEPIIALAANFAIVALLVWALRRRRPAGKRALTTDAAADSGSLTPPG
jgi:uncharacterized membrane protein (DUF2068 family)